MFAYHLQTCASLVRHPQRPLHFARMLWMTNFMLPSLSVLCLQAVAAAQAELADLKAKYGGLTRQYDEAVHKINLAKQASWRQGGCCWRDLAALQLAARVEKQQRNAFGSRCNPAHLPA